MDLSTSPSIKKVVIITVNYKQNKYTIDCINSLLKLNYTKFDIILIDNGPDEQDFNSLQNQIDKRVIIEKLSLNKGYVGGINYGLIIGEKLLPDYFLILNNDTIIDPLSLSSLVTTSEKFKDNCIVSGKVYHYNDPQRLQYIGHKLINKKLLKFVRIGSDEIDNGQYDQMSERDLLDDIFWLIPFELYKKVGRYSDYFWFNGESADYAFRAKGKGYKLIYTPDAKLWHKGSISAGGRIANPKLTYWQIQSTLIFRYLHLNIFYFLIFYSKLLLSVLWGYLKSFRDFKEQRTNRQLILSAKIKAIQYFNLWLFSKKSNDGYNPF